MALAAHILGLVRETRGQMARLGQGIPVSIKVRRRASKEARRGGEPVGG